MKAIGDVQTVGCTHFVDRASLLSFLDEMVRADSVEHALRDRLLEADTPPAPRPLRIALPDDLRNVMLRDLPESIKLSPGKLEISGPTALAIVESLTLLAQAMKNDLDQVEIALEPPAPVQNKDIELHNLLVALRYA